MLLREGVLAHVYEMKNSINMIYFTSHLYNNTLCIVPQKPYKSKVPLVVYILEVYSALFNP